MEAGPHNTILMTIAVIIAVLAIGYTVRSNRTIQPIETQPPVVQPIVESAPDASLVASTTTSTSSVIEVNAFTLSSTAFVDGGVIPEQYTCDAKVPMSPPLSIRNIPTGTKTMVLVMDDSDIPESIKIQRGITKFNHWSLFGISGDVMEIPEATSMGTSGLNGRGTEGYIAPCPPKDLSPSEHLYSFRLYASPKSFVFKKLPTLDELEALVKPDALGKTELIGRYQRK